MSDEKDRLGNRWHLIRKARESQWARQHEAEIIDRLRHAQVFAPTDKDYTALEPMTAPTSALTSDRGLQLRPGAGREGRRAGRGDIAQAVNLASTAL